MVREYTVKTVKIPQGQTITKDFRFANKSIGVDKTPTGYTWHHSYELGELQLIPTELHKAVQHTGGKAIERAMK